MGGDAPGRGGVGVFNHVKRDICVARPRASKANSGTGGGDRLKREPPETLRLHGLPLLAGCTGLESTGPWWRSLPTGHAFAVLEIAEPIMHDSSVPGSSFRSS